MLNSSKITLSCEICNQKNYRTKKSIEKRLNIKKFCSNCNKHTMHKEEK